MPTPCQRPDFSANAPLQGAGMPQERLAQIAARLTFVDLKQRYAAAAAGVPGSRGDWLRVQVRQTEELSDLWLLRGAVFSALRELDSDRASLARLDLYSALASVFPDDEALMPVLS
ncbi:MAG: hypothetical protein IPP87_10335 [Ideonella sp.]|nr:hypothetical protein [Ideonella sp.]MBL0149079.1 hypothetical protein [Ideonella sp.]